MKQAVCWVFALVGSIAVGQAFAQELDAAAFVRQLSPPSTKTRGFVIEAAPPQSVSLQVQFDLNSAIVRGESHAVLKQLAVAMQSPELQAAQFAVEGHTDAKGSAKSNLKLSLERARAVAQLLISQGVSAERLQPTGKGTSDPADTANPYAAVNRRVRVVRLQE